jgi:hypothetical protein
MDYKPTGRRGMERPRERGKAGRSLKAYAFKLMFIEHSHHATS